jgi:hypothetical protein
MEGSCEDGDEPLGSLMLWRTARDVRAAMLPKDNVQLHRNDHKSGNIGILKINFKC